VGHPSSVWVVTFSPNGQQIASQSRESVHFWDIQTQKCVHQFSIREDSIRSANFSPDGQTLATGSNDGIIRLWDIKTGRCKVILQSPRPYEDTNITGVQGLSEAQRTSLLALGAIDFFSQNS
jgi:WD40 repeat protein